MYPVFWQESKLEKVKKIIRKREREREACSPGQIRENLEQNVSNRWIWVKGIFLFCVLLLQLSVILKLFPNKNSKVLKYVFPNLKKKNYSMNCFSKQK